MRKHDVEVRYSGIRHPRSNPSERCMREISKFCRIYCHLNHRKWAELIPHIANWLNNTVTSVTLYTPAELLFGAERNNVYLFTERRDETWRNTGENCKTLWENEAM